MLKGRAAVVGIKARDKTVRGVNEHALDRGGAKVHAQEEIAPGILKAYAF